MLPSVLENNLMLKTGFCMPDAAKKKNNQLLIAPGMGVFEECKIVIWADV